MAWWDDLSRFAGNLTGGLIGESDEERRRKQRQQQQRAKAQPAQRSWQAPVPGAYGTDRPAQRSQGTVSFGIQPGESMAQSQARAGVMKRKAGLSLRNEDDIDQQIDEQRRADIDRSFDEGKSFEEISDRTGLGVEEVRRYAEKKRPGYGVKPLTLGNALSSVGDAIVDTGEGIGKAAGKALGLYTAAPLNQDRENAYQAARGALERGEITNQKFYELTGQLAEGIVGKKVVRDDKGNISLQDQNAVEFAKDFTDAGKTVADIMPVATGANLATKAAGRLLPQVVKEGAAWGTADTVNDAIQGRLTPEGIAANYALNIGLEGAGAGAVKGVEYSLQQQRGPNAERGSIRVSGFRGQGDQKKVTTEHGLSILGNDVPYYAFDEDTAAKFGEVIERRDIELGNPLIIDSDQKWRDIVQKSGAKYVSPVGLDKAATKAWIAGVRKAIEDEGYDGVVVRIPDDEATGKTIGRVFGSDQIVPFKQPVDKVAVQAKLDALRGGGKQQGYVEKEAPTRDVSPETLMTRATNAGMSEASAASLMKKYGRNKFAIMLDESNNLRGATNPNALAASVLAKIPDGNKTIGGTATKGDTFISDFEKLRQESFDFDGDDEVWDLVDSPEAKRIYEEGRKRGFEIGYDDSWGGFVMDIIDDGSDMPTVARRVADMAKNFDMDLKVNPDGTIRLYHGTTPEMGAKLRKEGFEGGVNTFFSPSKDIEFGGVNGAGYYGEDILTVDVDPRALTLNPSGELSVDIDKAVRPGTRRIVDTELKQLDANPAPNAKMKDGLQDVQAPPMPRFTQDVEAGTPNFARSLTEALPQDNKLDPADYDAAIAEGTEAVRTHFDMAASRAEAVTGKSWDEVITDINRKNFDSSYQIDPRVEQFYRREIQPVFDELYEFSGKVKGEQDYYIPQGRDFEPQPTTINGILLDSNMIKDEGFLQTRTGKAASRELEDGTVEFAGEQLPTSPEELARYATQTISARYEKARRIQQAAEENDISLEQAERGIDQLDEAIEEVIDVANSSKIDQLLSGKPIRKLRTVSKLSEAGKELGKERWNLTSDGHSPVQAGSGIVEDWRRMSDWKIKIDGDVTTVFDMGFRQYEDAHGLSRSILTRAETEGITYTEAMTKFLDEEFPHLPDSEKGAVLSRFERQQGDIRFDEAEGMSQEQVDRLNQIAVQSVRNASRMQLSNMAQHLDLPDSKTGKHIEKVMDYHMNRMLMDGQVNRSFAEAISQTITGLTYRGLLGYSPQSALMNLTETQRILTTYGVKEPQAFWAAVTPSKINHYIDEYGTISNRHAAKDYVMQNATLFEKFSNNIRKNGAANAVATFGDPMAMFNGAELIKNVALLEAAESYWKKQGLKGTNLRRQVLSDFREIALMSGGTNVMGLNRGPGAKMLTQFWQWNVRNIGMDWRMLTNKTSVGKFAKEDQNTVKMLAQIYGQRTAIFIGLNSLYGASAAYAFGIFDPVGMTQERWNGIDKEDQTTVDKIVDHLPVSPVTGMMRDVYYSVRIEQERAEGVARGDDEDDKTPGFQLDRAAADPKNLRNLANLAPGGNQLINRMGVVPFLDTGFSQDVERGYNENRDGRARFTAPEAGSVDWFRGMAFGRYSTPEAREYFGSADVVRGAKDSGTEGFLKEVVRGLREMFPITKEESRSKKPIGKRYQEKLENIIEEHGVDRGKIGELILEAREYDGKRDEYLKKNPAAQAAWDEISKVTWNPKTQKYESDVISPERWKAVAANTDGKLFDFMKARAEQRNKDFGDPLDPIYGIEDVERRRQILALRASYTGEDGDIKSPLYDQPWYQEFQDKMTAYYDELEKRQMSDGEFGSTERAQRYFDLSKKRPQRSDRYKQYIALRYGDNPDEAAGKAFYKQYADELGAERESYYAELLKWTNQMRKLEGVPQIPAEEWAKKNELGEHSKSANWGSSKGYTDKDGNWVSYARRGRSGGGSGSNPPNTGVASTITSLGNEGAGMKLPTGPKGKMKNLKTVVKTKRAKGTSPIRIRI